MKKMFKLLLSVLLLLVVTSSIFTSVRADDDDDEKKEHHEQKYEDEGGYRDNEYDDKGDDEEERDEYDFDYLEQNENKQQVKEVMESWSKWSRSAKVNDPHEPLPIVESQNVKLQNDNQSITVMAYLSKGEILVPIKETAELLGAEVVIYEKIEAIEVFDQQKDLIYKLGSRAAYENGLKTPMSVPIVSYQNKMYSPISVLANGLGYTITYDSQEGFVFTHE